MDYYAIVEKICSGANFNPACFNFTEEEARKRKLWRDERAMPTLEELEAADIECKAELASNAHKHLRQREYPPIGDQLDTIIKQFITLRMGGTDMIQDMDDLIGKVNSIKAKYPKC